MSISLATRGVIWYPVRISYHYHVLPFELGIQDSEELSLNIEAQDSEDQIQVSYEAQEDVRALEVSVEEIQVESASESSEGIFLSIQEILEDE